MSVLTLCMLFDYAADFTLPRAASSCDPLLPYTIVARLQMYTVLRLAQATDQECVLQLQHTPRLPKLLLLVVLLKLLPAKCLAPPKKQKHRSLPLRRSLPQKPQLCNSVNSSQPNT